MHSTIQFRNTTTYNATAYLEICILHSAQYSFAIVTFFIVISQLYMLGIVKVISTSKTLILSFTDSKTYIQFTTHLKKLMLSKVLSILIRIAN